MILSRTAAARMSEEFRTGDGQHLRLRRGVTGLSLVASGAMALITAYQTGIIRMLPEPPLPRLDAETIDAAPEAYRLLATPDAALGLASYAATTVLATMGGADRARGQPLIPLALAAKVTLDVAAAGKLTVDQWTHHRAFCFWCLLGAAASFASLPLVMPEARAAWQHLRNTEH
ncbi:MAG: vitamin K epoxide reductase [Chloroflexota bacterium]|nr:vitamin K epoxide reductase [Chloroflexota bacterium]